MDINNKYLNVAGELNMRDNFSFYKIKPFYSQIIICLIFSLGTLGHAHGEERGKIITHNPNSKIAINYTNWTLLLKATVTRARQSSRIYAQKRQANIGSKISNSSSSPTRLEASRVFYHYLGDEELDYIHTLRLGMESLPQAIPLQNLNRNEQLAYWLNLYNITVYEQIAMRYPISKLKKLRKGTRKTPSMWDEKLLNVNGINMSLNDIQYNIIEKTWADPIVLYGLYHGTIGGPNLRRKAYSGKLVYEQLEDNAKEFVNSLRGLRFQGKTALTSIMYDWSRELFPNFKEDLRNHLRKYTNLRLTTRLDASRKLKAKVYDWHIADVANGGRSHAGSAGSTNPVSLVMNQGSSQDSTFISGGGSSGFGLQSIGNKAIDTAALRNRMPNDAAVYLKEFIERNRKFKAGRVKIEEIERKDLKKQKLKTSNIYPGDN